MGMVRLSLIHDGTACKIEAATASVSNTPRGGNPATLDRTIPTTIQIARHARLPSKNFPHTRTLPFRVQAAAAIGSPSEINSIALKAVYFEKIRVVIKQPT